MAFHSAGIRSLAFLVSCTSGVQYVEFVITLYRNCWEIFLLVTLGSYLVMKVLQITRVICADV